MGEQKRDWDRVGVLRGVGGSCCSNADCPLASSRVELGTFRVKATGGDTTFLCRRCVDALHARLHPTEHTYGRHSDCPVCRAENDEEHPFPVLGCRYGFEHCVGCGKPAFVDRSSAYLELPPGWRVAEMEAMVDYHRFACSAECAEKDNG